MGLSAPVPIIGVVGATIGLLYYGIVDISLPVAIIWLALFGMSRKSACLAAGLVWLVPLPYEFWIQSTCSGDCSIRVDLLLVLPLELFVLTLATRTAIRAFRGYRQKRQPPW